MDNSVLLVLVVLLRINLLDNIIHTYYIYIITKPSGLKTQGKRKMAYITSEQVKAVREAIKKEFPNYKWSITGNHYSSITIALMSADFKVEKDYEQLNPFYLGHYSENINSVFSKVKEIMFKTVAYYDNSDSMTDYFAVAYYYNFHIGKWDKPYIQK